MGLFGNRDEINVKFLSGQIKAVCGRSFMGSGADVYVEGDTCTIDARYSLSSQAQSALGALDSAVVVSVTRYGSFEVFLLVSKYCSKEKQVEFPRISAALEAKGYGVFCRTSQSDTERASMTITKDGATKDNWKEELTKMLNDIAIGAIRPLSMV